LVPKNCLAMASYLHRTAARLKPTRTRVLAAQRAPLFLDCLSPAEILFSAPPGALAVSRSIAAKGAWPVQALRQKNAMARGGSD
jgi:hypothetical protein